MYRATLGDFETYARRDLAVDVTATASRSLRLLGSLRVAPTVGVFGLAEQSLTYSASPLFVRPPATRASAGLHLEVPLSFRLFGTTATVSAVGRVAPLATGGSYGVGLHQTYAGGGLRLNF